MQETRRSSRQQRKRHVRARSRDMRCGLTYQRYDALWRFASIPKRVRRDVCVMQLLMRSQVLMQADPGPYYRCPMGTWSGENINAPDEENIGRRPSGRQCRLRKKEFASFHERFWSRIPVQRKEQNKRYTFMGYQSRLQCGGWRSHRYYDNPEARKNDFRWRAMNSYRNRMSGINIRRHENTTDEQHEECHWEGHIILKENIAHNGLAHVETYVARIGTEYIYLSISSPNQEPGFGIYCLRKQIEVVFWVYWKKQPEIEHSIRYVLRLHGLSPADIYTYSLKNGDVRILHYNIDGSNNDLSSLCIELLQTVYGVSPEAPLEFEFEEVESAILPDAIIEEGKQG